VGSVAAASDRHNVHATALAMGDRGVVIRGPSGSGKSDLALRCLGLAASELVPLPFRLIADDWVELARAGVAVALTCPHAIVGRLEVRGVGIVRIQPVETAQLALVVDLVSQSQPIERLPENETAELLGLRVPRLALHAFEVSAPLKIALALRGSAEES
jgi:HPr kinase/phosphorylase